MEILSVNSAEFAPYGRILDGYDTTELVSVLEHTVPSEQVKYILSEPRLEKLPIAETLSTNAFGGLKIQIGECFGKNTKLNCLEYHTSSEINCGSGDYILLLAKMDDIKNGRLDTSAVKAFKVPSGVLVEIYATTLHYAPCCAQKDKQFNVLVVLPKGTNEEIKNKCQIKNDVDKTLWAVNKWLLAHEQSDEAADGAQVLLDGENIDIADLI